MERDDCMPSLSDFPGGYQAIQGDLLTRMARVENTNATLHVAIMQHISACTETNKNQIAKSEEISAQITRLGYWVVTGFTILAIGEMFGLGRAISLFMQKLGIAP
jgi:hypothetical protein